MAMDNNPPRELELGSQLFVEICARLNVLTPQDQAACQPDLFSGGFKFSDEVPADWDTVIEQRIPLVNLFRCLWAYRASLVVKEPRQDLAEYWDATQKLAPRWPGFSPERSSPAMMRHIKEGDRRARKLCVELERMDRELQAKSSSVVHM